LSYNHLEIDKKWQDTWSKSNSFVAENNSSKPKYYALDMFPYPSGSGLHVGHIASYTPADIISRYKRACGFNVLHPMGYDAFGLPAEQYAIQTGIHPAITTKNAIENFRRQLMAFGFSFDWTREISTCDPEYYKWTQFIFLKLWEKGLAYQKEVPVNWCPALKTVLANEEVVDGKSERGGHPVIRMPMRQWMLKITDYAERLLNDLELVDWPERTKEGQRNWIGKSEGAEIDFTIEDHPEKLKVYTTRPDTIFGVTFMVIAPEHPLILKITKATQLSEVKNYIEKSSRKSEVDRKAATEKSGVFTGAYALNPFNQMKIPIWTSDYVLMDYGTGAIMAVPGHDERDFEFAQKFSLEVKQVVSSIDKSEIPLPYVGDGIAVNSDFLNGKNQNEALKIAISEIEKRQIGIKKIQYKLRDWLFSRQRYWGEPFPMLRLSDGTLKSVPENELPVALPEVADYEPTENGEPPLARVNDWVTYDAHTKRETDTMPGSAGSSWYFLRYTDPKNSNQPFSFEAQKYWMPVDIYIGGAEHTVGHLLYARFWQKVLFDIGLTSSPEPFKKLFHQGLIMGPDGEKMSKSRGNTINADEARDGWGADATRMYICFMGPTDKDKNWSTTGIEGVRRFLERVWRLGFDEAGNVLASKDEPSPELNKTLHKTIKKVTEDIENLSFNTSISQMMILVNEAYKLNEKPIELLKTLSQLMMPFAPHLAEEIWSRLGGQGLVSLAPWPKYDPALVIDDEATMGVQVNGKMRGTILISLKATEAEAIALALAVPTVTQAMQNQSPKKVIYKAGKILNIIV
jgi:leucyl-tRNA synthetase